MPDRYYFEKAREMRQLATKAHDDQARDEFLRLALEYEALAQRVETPARDDR